MVIPVDMTSQQLEIKNSATVSRVIKDAVSSGLVNPYDPEAGAKAMRYVPHWS
ncbi:transcriptional regulator [Vibrio sp.]|uniref:transcriptional regulator n=1 Tax=Vibrio sp. TaxID=678 RepID=UPI002A73B5C8|nr:Transcriptional regulator [Vibrio crassostreae]CAK2222378.1 Transcriptional regulator [Vibrio crassostreae]CAK2222588.1 Transcriptional regulator [Vibrio crassostreae]CAK2224862.1 Transcriptional regulator [Vibrio crassostreae]CAK2235710.1 Transcriptional regulator [Vibrio crassostreae]